MVDLITVVNFLRFGSHGPSYLVLEMDMTGRTSGGVPVQSVYLLFVAECVCSTGCGSTGSTSRRAYQTGIHVTSFCHVRYYTQTPNVFLRAFSTGINGDVGEVIVNREDGGRELGFDGFGTTLEGEERRRKREGRVRPRNGPYEGGTETGGSRRVLGGTRTGAGRKSSVAYSIRGRCDVCKSRHLCVDI